MSAADIINNIDTIGVVVIGLILAYQRFKTGSSSMRKEIAAEYKERNEQYKEDIAKLNDDITKYRLENATLLGKIEEILKHNKMLTELLQGKNPEMVQLLAEVKNTNVEMLKFMEKLSNTFDSFMNKGV